MRARSQLRQSRAPRRRLYLTRSNTSRAVCSAGAWSAFHWKCRHGGCRRLRTIGYHRIVRRGRDRVYLQLRPHFWPARSLVPLPAWIEGRTRHTVPRLWRSGSRAVAAAGGCHWSTWGCMRARLSLRFCGPRCLSWRWTASSPAGNTLIVLGSYTEIHPGAAGLDRSMNGLSDAPACSREWLTRLGPPEYVPATEGAGICSSFRRT